MEYINLTIITLKDLLSIDENVNSIQEEIRHIEEQTKYAIHPEKSLEDDETAKLIGGLLGTISNLKVDGDPQDKIKALKLLEEDHKGLKLVNDLIALYENQLQARRDQLYLDQSSIIEDEISHLNDTFLAYQVVYDKIDKLDDTNIRKELISIKTDLIALFNSKVLQLKQSLQTNLSNLLTEISWLTANFSREKLTLENARDINKLVSELIVLQSVNNAPVYPETWWAIDTLLEPFFMRFDYHFNTKRDTNRISKPEWAFNFIEEFLTKNIKVFEIVINQSFRNLKLIMIFQVITGILVPIRNKILDIFNILNQRIEETKDSEDYDKIGRLLSHLIFELTSFDQRLRNEYKYNPFIKRIDEVPNKKWLGLTADVLLQGDKERLGTSNWLSFENRLANDRFDSEIINSVDSLRVDMDYKNDLIENDTMKPTYSALNLVKLFDNLTSHYQTMRMVKFQLKFVSTIQLKLLDRYCEHLNGVVLKFDELYNALRVLNIIPGNLETSTRLDSNDGLKAITMLTEIHCLTQFILQHLEQWSENLIFIQLWNAYKAVSKKQYNEESTIFASTIHQYTKLNAEVMKRYDVFFKKEIRNYLKEYINSSQWDIDEVKDNSLQFALLIRQLPLYLDHIKQRVLSTSYFTIANDVCTCLFQLWYEYIITNNKFTIVGVKQLEQDFHFVIDHLQAELLLINNELISTKYNNYYLKVLQSIHVLGKFELDFTKSIAIQHNDEIRQKFDDRLSNLLDDEIKEILYRII